MELINTDATFSFWIKFSSDKEWQTVIGSKNGESAWTSGFLFGGADLPFNDVYFWGCNKEGVITFDITTNLNTWQHFAASYDYSNQSVRLYHNGAYNNTDICTDNGDINMTNIILGAYGSSIGDEFNGTLDEVRIWNRSLTDAEINQTYHSNLKKYDTNKWEFYTNQTNLVAGNYTYQAHAIDTDGAGNETEVRYLEIPDLIPPTTPTLYTPIDGNNTIVDRTPTLIWNNSFDANGDTITYELMVGTNSSFPSPTINQTNLTEGVADTTNYTITDALTTDIPYYWKVRAYDETEYSDWSTSFNFTVESYVSISLPVAAMNFTSLNLSRSYDTTDRDPNPFVIQNNGNVLSNLTITGNQFFASGAFPGSNYQFKIQENETGSITNASSTTTWTNMPLTSSTIDIYELNWNDTKDTAEMHLKLAVPADEPPGIKSVQINFTVP